MIKKVIVEPYVNYDGVLSKDERKKILAKVESAFCWLGATMPEEIELNGEKFRLQEEIQNLIMKGELTSLENKRIQNLISALENKRKFLKSVVKNEDISEDEAIELSDILCGLLRAVHELRELIKKAPKSKAFDAKAELMRDINDKKRWMKFQKQIH